MAHGTAENMERIDIWKIAVQDIRHDPEYGAIYQWQSIMTRTADIVLRS